MSLKLYKFVLKVYIDSSRLITYFFFHYSYTVHSLKNPNIFIRLWREQSCVQCQACRIKIKTDKVTTQYLTFRLKNFKNSNKSLLTSLKRKLSSSKWYQVC